MNCYYPSVYSKEYLDYTQAQSAQQCCDTRACQLKVEGKGTIEVRPDIAVAVLEVITESRDLVQAQEENAKTITAVLKSLSDNGIPSKDIQTQSYNIYPQYDYTDGKQIFRGYRVEHSLKVTVRDMARIGKVIDDAVKSGVNQVSSINFSVANPSAYYQTALAAAVDDALLKASTLGRKLNIAVCRVPLKIEEIETGVPVTPKMYQTTGTGTPIQTGLVEITALIHAVFAYRPAY